MNSLIPRRCLSFTLVVSLLLAPTAFAGLVGHWNFEAGVQDVGPNSLGGTAVGTASVVTDGTRGQVLSLSNTADSYVDVADNALLNLSQAATVTAWINLINGGPDAVVSKGQWTDSYSIRLDDLGSQPNVINFAGRNPTSSSGAVGIGQWVHIAVTFDNAAAGDDTSFYINGTLDSTADRGSALTVNNTPLRIGYANQPWSRWNGMIDDVQIYDRALSPSEVQFVQAGGVIPEPGTLALLLLAGVWGLKRLPIRI